MKTYAIATIPGDGIGKEVVPAGQQVLEALAAASNSVPLRVRELRLGRRLLPRARRDDAGRRPGRAPRQGRHPVRLGRRPAHPRPHHAVGPAPEDLPGLRPVRQRAAHAHPARHRRPAEALRPGRPELGHRARELRRRILRRRRPRAPGPPDRGGHRRVDDDPRRCRAHHALRLQARPVAPAQAAHRHHQEQRAAPRDGDVGRDRAADLEGVPRRHAGTRNWSTRRRRA